MKEGLVLLASFGSPVEAHIAKSMLESEGIESFLLDENIVTINSLYVNAIGGVKLQVWESDAERARELLATEAPLEATVACPKCRGARFVLVTESAEGRKFHCQGCGETWG